MLNVNFINTGEVDFDGDIYKDDEALNNWIELIKKLTGNIYSFKTSDFKIREILKDDGKLWKVYAFAKAINNEDGEKGIVTQSIVIYKLMASEKGYQIYNLYQIGAVAPKFYKDEALNRFMEKIDESILSSMLEIKESSKKRIIFYENIRESNVLYKVYDDMETESEKENLIVKMIENGTYNDGETKILVLMRFKGKKKLKIFDEIEKAADFSRLIKNTSPRTTYTTMVTKPVFEGDGYKIYDKVTYANASEIGDLHNENMVKQREGDYFRKIINKPKSIILVAKDDEGKIVGYILTRPEYSPILRNSKGLYNTMNFVGIVVSPNMRGKGVAQELIRLMEERVKEMNQFEYIFGHVRFSNKSAQRLYRKLGYSLLPVGRYKDTKEIKYRLFKRIKRPDIGRHFSEFRTELIIGFVLVVGHEIIHQIRDYEGKI
ncbi:MAG: GNAT family N-acetyltransferase [Flavobacteriaceae bacterium]|jgi:ribosomal protein S18 acetylase RimI-like enzyme|nr:GNAT family N-acetyltransferase [Flavobacteriaceae bacterium]